MHPLVPKPRNVTRRSFIGRSFIGSYLVILVRSLDLGPAVRTFPRAGAQREAAVSALGRLFLLGRSARGGILSARRGGRPRHGRQGVAYGWRKDSLSQHP